MDRFPRKTLTTALVVFCVSASLWLETPAQIRPIYDQGALGVAQLLKRLNTTASVLMIGAHPDDEDTALLAYLARGESAQTAYLSLTRGDGGQNIIGPELGEALGVIRTEELLQARKLDGAEQYFTRAYDFGFSKTLAEAQQKWDEKIILCDVVRVIRQFRPLVVISQFSGTSADGHGQHQYAGYITPLAVKAAADTSQCIDGTTTWQVKKFYVRHRGTAESSLRINTGKYDPLLGRSYFEIAMEARSQHKSQEQGVLELKGEQFSSLSRITNGEATPVVETGIFDGLDTSYSGMIPVVESLPATFSREGVAEIGGLVEKIQSEYRKGGAPAIVPDLLLLREKLTEQVGKFTCLDEPGEATSRKRYSGRCSGLSVAQRSARDYYVAYVSNHGRLVNRAAQLALGIQVDALADRETAVFGEEFAIAVRVFVPDATKVKVEISINQTIGLDVRQSEAPIPDSRLTRTERATKSAFFTAKLTGSTTDFVTEPAWLVRPREGFLYTGPFSASLHNPFGWPAAEAVVKINLEGHVFFITQPVEYRYADDVRGEVRREPNIVPRVSVDLNHELVIAPRSGKPLQREVIVSVDNNSVTPASGTVTLAVPARWIVSPSIGQIMLAERGRKASVKFVVTVPANTSPGSYELSAEAMITGGKFVKSMKAIAYPHIQTHRIYKGARAQVKVIDLRTTPSKIGYIRGSGDRVPEAIKQLGLEVEELDDVSLSTDDLSKFDTIVVGIRAYQVRPDLVANNQRLTDFMTNGGTLIVQYQLPATYSQQNLTPFPTQMGPRVVDENAPVTIVEPTHPIFNFPNKISSEDFSGWVQERNLYNFVQMDPRYVGLLESHDAGEQENNGGLVVAEIGNGNFVYCSYSLFRQLPAGVPGAYRLLANMLSLPKAKK